MRNKDNRYGEKTENMASVSKRWYPNVLLKKTIFFSLSNGGTVRKNLGEQDIQIASFINKFGRRLSTI